MTKLNVLVNYPFKY